jgi:predicted ATPase
MTLRTWQARDDDHDRILEAERYFRTQSGSQRQRAKMLELRANERPLRVMIEQQREIGARELSAPLYNWFTEGFATPELKGAKALLDP